MSSLEPVPVFLGQVMKQISPILLLTACVKPNGMPQTAIKFVDERLRQYRESLNFYLAKTNFDVVFCENTGMDISEHYEKEIQKGRLEVLTYEGNDFDKIKGKGYGECQIVAHALQHSQKLKQASMYQPVVKISGRHIVRNIKSIVNFTNLFIGKKSTFVCAHINNRTKGAISDFYIGTLNFHQLFINNQSEIDESKGVWYEHVLFSTMEEYYHNKKGEVLNLPVPLYQIGVSGSTGEPFIRPSYKDYMKSILKCIAYKTGMLKID